MTQAALGRRLAELGHPMSKDMLWKVEQNRRHLGPDDLLAFAISLGVTPNRLMLPAGGADVEVELTATVSLPLSQVWAWASGDMPLDVEQPGVLATHPAEFRRQNRVHDVIRAYSALNEDK